MGTGIVVCGLNGCGKSTLGRALAEKTGFHFIDNENLYFPGRKAGDPYAQPSSREEAERLLMDEVRGHDDFVFAAVKGDYGNEIIPMYSCAVVIKVPGEIRRQRIRNRSFQKFGQRMLAGGDLYEQEESFFRMAESRQEDYVEGWLETLDCPVIRVDGTKPVKENIERIIKLINIQSSL